MRPAGTIVGTVITATIQTTLPFSFVLVPGAIAVTVVLCRTIALV